MWATVQWDDRYIVGYKVEIRLQVHNQAAIILCYCSTIEVKVVPRYGDGIVRCNYR